MSPKRHRIVIATSLLISAPGLYFTLQRLESQINIPGTYMKRTILQMMLVVGLAACSVGFAQAQNSEHYKTEIPFDFTVGKKQYAAGTYSIEVAGAGQR